jgi:CYTH domain-containing protein
VISNDFKNESYKQTRITQGFLNTNPERTVRVRVKGDKGYLTIKGLSSTNGLSRYEWEKEISEHDANQLLKLCEKGIIDKTRYEINIGEHTFEVDEFYGDNQGLVIAEVELQNESEAFEKPNWLGKEITGIKKYYNSQLSINPYKLW